MPPRFELSESHLLPGKINAEISLAKQIEPDDRIHMTAERPEIIQVRNHGGKMARPNRPKFHLGQGRPACFYHFVDVKYLSGEERQAKLLCDVAVHRGVRGPRVQHELQAV